ncbi:MAG: hypothetical protein QG649_206 [Patescibacteria group bacterium]|nr:hypothetical protein [Patescibacteria group bacterium]
MSRNTKSWVVLPLTTIVAMVLTLLGSITAPASAVAGDPIIPPTPSCTVTLVSGDPVLAPPAPTCYDPSGSDLDEFLVPLYYDVSGNQVIYRSASWSPYKWDQPNSSRGSSQVSVFAATYDSVMGGYVDKHSWTLSFNTASIAQPPANAYWVVVGKCDWTAGSPFRPVTAFFRNEVGVDGRYVGYLSLETGVTEPAEAMRVLDGATVGLPLVVDEYQLGLPADNDQVEIFEVAYWLEDRSTVPGSGVGTRRMGAKLQISVPACRYDGNDPGTGTSVKPQAKIIVLKRGPVYSKVKVVLGSRKATQPTRYQVIRDPRRGPTLRKTYLTKYKAVTYYKVKRGTLIKVRSKTVLAKRRV